MNSISENKSVDEISMNDIYLQRLYKLLAMKEEEYRIRSKFKSQYRFVLSIEELQKLEKLSHL
jgi:hypothetical protein